MLTTFKFKKVQYTVSAQALIRVMQGLQTSHFDYFFQYKAAKRTEDGIMYCRDIERVGVEWELLSTDTELSDVQIAKMIIAK